MDNNEKDEIRSAVRDNYGKVAAVGRAGCGCAPSSCCGTPGEVRAADISLAMGYSGEDVAAVPEGADMGLGCGNPQAIASLQPGETVLDRLNADARCRGVADDEHAQRRAAAGIFIRAGVLRRHV